MSGGTVSIQSNGGGNGTPTGFIATQPLTVAGAFLVSVQAVMAALFGIIDDAQALPWLTLGTQATITFAASSIAVFLTLVWAARHTTPKLAPVLAENTVVGVTNGSQKVVATATIPSASDAVAAQSGGSSNAGN